MIENSIVKKIPKGKLKDVLKEWMIIQWSTETKGETRESLITQWSKDTKGEIRRRNQRMTDITMVKRYQRAIVLSVML
jgi:DNA transposition AAA+ family ATPase